MKKFFTILSLLAVTYSYGQCLSPDKIVFENDKQISLNNGMLYEKIAEKNINTLSQSQSIALVKEVGDIKLRLNRILVVKNANAFKEVLEYTSGIYTFYDYKDIKNVKSKKKISVVVLSYNDK